MDKLAQASLDALVTLVGTVPEADLQWTLEGEPPRLRRDHHAFATTTASSSRAAI